ncbi:MAG: hypothetical protein UU67_C0049G0014 [Candidatus Daviesbacteria bacterium GW2011_GWB1_41_5]|uniref:Uncharacterized protein n=1 Tax=Candidatus Daviesbacteria bacterium GW2011_GWB1_41_5 TaxID=1618429 RepID=A0A0G0WI59_9BACT|nr:MAG: hypothetical protein UU67_C0049G0014 [Candidatus Daviesbacteria bacterium GW2011_GWB1_41_5]
MRQWKAQKPMKKNKDKITNSTIPQLQFAVLCDGVTALDQRGKISFVGVFDKFLRPGIIPHFSLVIGWKNGRGMFNQRVKFLDPDLKQILETPDMPIELKHETDGTRSILNIDGMNFTSPGVYWIEILLEKETVLSIPFAVEKSPTIS